MAVQQSGTASRQPVSGKKTIPRRSFGLYLLLCLATCGLYHFWFLSQWAKDVNTICAEDGERTLPVWEMLALGIPTLGVYPLLWQAWLLDRMYNNAPHYGADVRGDGETFFLWVMLLPLAGPLVAMALAVRDMNRLAAAYEEYKPQPEHQSVRQEHRQERQQEHRQSPAPAPETPEPPRQGGLRGLTGCCAGQKIPLRPGEKIRLGRDAAKVSVVVTGDRVSRVHCTVQYYGEKLGYSIEDRSRNGVLLNGKRLRPGQPTYAAPGSVLALADGGNKFQLL